MNSEDHRRAQKALAVVAAVSAAAGLIATLWQVVFLLFGMILGERLHGLDWIVRNCALSGVVATLVMLPLWRPLVRLASMSTLVAVSLIPTGWMLAYQMLPRYSPYAVF